MKISTLMLSTLAGLTLAGTALGQAGTGATISDANMFFTTANSPTSATGTGAASADFRAGGAASTDHMFQHWWWYRLAGDNRENAFANASSSATIGTSIHTISYTYATFTAFMEFEIISTGADSGFLRSSLSITNTSAAPISITLFNYTDLDVNGSFGGDSALLTGPNTIRVNDGRSLTYSGIGASAWQVAAFSQVRDLLANNVVDNFNSTLLPFGPGDFTGGFQWSDVVIDPGFTRSVVATVSITPVPTPGAAALVGLAGLVGLRRRR